MSYKQNIKMDLFHILGDVTHFTTMLALLLYIWRKGSCTGLSGRTQILFALLFTARYMDLFTTFASVYNYWMKVVYIAITYVTVLSIYFKYKSSCTSQYDSFRSETLVIAAAIIAIFVNYDFTLLEITWAFSEYLEALAIIPQLYLVSKAGKSEKVVSYYIFGLTAYRSFYIVHWAYRYYYTHHFDLISVVPGIIQVLIYLDYFFALFSSQLISKYQKVRSVSTDGNMKYPVFVLSHDTVPSSPQKSSPVDVI